MRGLCQDSQNELKMDLYREQCYLSLVTSRVSPISCNYSGDQARAILSKSNNIALDMYRIALFCVMSPVALLCTAYKINRTTYEVF